MKLINIGFGNLVSASRLIAIVSPESAPIKRIVQDVRERGELIDATYGRRTRAVIIMDSGHVILSALQPETVSARMIGRSEEPSAEERKDDGGARECGVLRIRHNTPPAPRREGGRRLLFRFPRAL